MSTDLQNRPTDTFDPPAFRATIAGHTVDLIGGDGILFDGKLMSQEDAKALASILSDTKGAVSFKAEEVAVSRFLGEPYRAGSLLFWKEKDRFITSRSGTVHTVWQARFWIDGGGLVFETKCRRRLQEIKSGLVSGSHGTPCKECARQMEAHS